VRGIPMPAHTPVRPNARKNKPVGRTESSQQ
jgi:hypothetical protein